MKQKNYLYSRFSHLFSIMPIPTYANNNPLLMKKKMSLRTKIYLIVTIYLILAMITCIQVYASLGGYEIQDLYENITANVKDSNALLKKAFDFTATSPYTIINSLSPTSGSGLIAVSIIGATETVALSVASLLLMIEFFRKTITFEWVSKWENVLIFLVKIIVLKQVIQIADVIVGYIYSCFQTINNAAIGGNVDFLPCGNEVIYNFKEEYRGDTIFEWFASHVYTTEITYSYHISPDSVKMFYPNATFPSGTNFDIKDFPFESPLDTKAFTPLVEMVLLQPFFLIMKGIGILIFVIAIGRVLELSVYTFFAPLPLATFASDVTNDIAKSFIKNYIACVIQIAVIAVMFVVYVAMNGYFSNATNGYSTTKLIQLVCLVSLALGVIKSGSWARKICGTS
jgi:hypothetical protein